MVNKIFRFVFVAAIFVIASEDIQAVNDKEPWQDINVISQGKELPRATFFAYANDKNADIGDKSKSAYFKSLNGPWKFKWSASPKLKPAEFHTPAFDSSSWASIQVPSVWERQGYGYPVYANIEYPFIAKPFVTPTGEQNHVGSYIKRFKIPPHWDGRRIYLQFGAVSSAMTLWVNGKRVGYSQGSRTPAEFDLTDYVQHGENSLAVEVMRWSDASWLENQDSWSLSGIFRDVELYARPTLQIRDFFAATSLENGYQDGVLDLSVDVRSYLNEVALADHTLELAYTIEGGDEVVANGTLAVDVQEDSASVNTKLRIPDVLAWSAERPSLYSLRLSLKKAGSTVEVIKQNIGFRSVELKHGRLLINGVAIKFRGVNVHEFHPETGYVVDEKTMLEDIRLLKRGNFNAVRTSHYPQHPRFYELADQYGLYVVDEANLETHLYRYEADLAPARKPEWAEQMLDRTIRMVERDKNHPSIVLWSPGNETGPGPNMTAIYQWTKQRDPSRLFQYADDTLTEGGNFKELNNRPFGKSSDILSAFYPSPWDLEQYAQEYNDKPWIIMEYWHSMGNSLGNGKPFWDTINRHSILQGGFIWDWVDQGLREEDKQGRVWYSHGGDYGPEGVPSSGNFLHNGLVFPNRSPKPAYWEVQKAHQPVTFESHDLAHGEIWLTNLHHFTNLAEFEIHWRVAADGLLIDKGITDIPDCAPGESTLVKLGSIKPRKLVKGAEYFVTLQLQRKKQTALDLISSKRIYATEQFRLPFYRANKPATKQQNNHLSVEQSDNDVTLKGERFSVSFHKKTGLITAYEYSQTPLLTAPLMPNFWRAMTDNDYGFQPQTWDSQWRNAFKNTRLTSFELSDKTIAGINVSVELALLGLDGIPLGNLSISYDVQANGAISIQTRFQRNDGVTMPPRFGLTMTLANTFENLEWFGRGPHENYIDRKWSSYIDHYSSTVEDQYTPYLRPQENGYKTDTRWLSLTDERKKGLLVVGVSNSATSDSSIGFSALPHSQESYEGGSKPDQKGDDRDKPILHLDDIESHKNNVFLSLDSIQAGVGGDNSWAKRTHNEFTPREGKYEFAFVIRGLEGTEKSIAALARTLRRQAQ